MDRPANLITLIVQGRRAITAETAAGLAAALGTSAEYWMNLESAYQLSRLDQDKTTTIGRRARVYEKAPVKEMIKRGWIEPTDDVEILERRVCAFFEIKSIDEEPELPKHAARKATGYGTGLTNSQRAWLFRVRQLGHAVHAQSYRPEKLERAIEQLKALRHAPEELRNIPRILSDAGIRFVIVERLPGSKIDGACLWLDNDEPVIAVTLRFDRIDHLWFVLMHELGHVKHHDTSIDVELDKPSEDRADAEAEANDFAQEQLIPQDALTSFIARVGPLYSRQRIEAFAHTVQVHPGIVVGQLHNRGMPYSRFRKFLIPVRERITHTALTDGWGSVVPVGWQS